MCLTKLLGRFFLILNDAFIFKILEIKNYLFWYNILEFVNRRRQTRCELQLRSREQRCNLGSSLFQLQSRAAELQFWGTTRSTSAASAHHLQYLLPCLRHRPHLKFVLLYNLFNHLKIHMFNVIGTIYIFRTTINSSFFRQ